LAIQYHREELIAALTERNMLFWRTLINKFLPQPWQVLGDSSTAPTNWRDEDWDAFDRMVRWAAEEALRYIESNGNVGDLTAHEVQSNADPMRRYLTLTTAETPQPFLARILMQTKGLSEGDMLQPELRYIGTQFQGLNDEVQADSPFEPQERYKRVRREVRRRSRRGETGSV